MGTEIPIIGRGIDPQQKALVAEWVHMIGKGQQAHEIMGAMTSNQMGDHQRESDKRGKAPDFTYMAIKELEQAIHSQAQLQVMQTYAVLAALGFEVPVPLSAVEQKEEGQLDG